MQIMCGTTRYSSSATASTRGPRDRLKTVVLLVIPGHFLPINQNVNHHNYYNCRIVVSSNK